MAFVDSEHNTKIAEHMGDMINDMFYEHYYYGAGSNFGFMINDILGGPKGKSEIEAFFLQ